MTLHAAVGMALSRLNKLMRKKLLLLTAALFIIFLVVSPYMALIQKGLGGILWILNDNRHVSDKCKEYTISSSCEPPTVVADTFYEHLMSNCRDSPLCGLNVASASKKLVFKEKKIEKFNIEQLLTVVTKTGGRYQQLIQMACAVWRFYPDMKVVIVDDLNENVNSVFVRFVESNKHRLTYRQLNVTNGGIARGRNEAIKLATTEYVFLIDDDLYMQSKLHMEDMMSLALNSDVSVVGADREICNFYGITGIGQVASPIGYSLEYNQFIARAHSEIEGYKNCYVVDVTENIFIARKSDIIQVGGWNEELIVAEHEDFFIKLKLANKKVAACPLYSVYHQWVLDSTRISRVMKFKNNTDAFKNIWKIDKITLHFP